MSRQQQDADIQSKSRPRANTTSFPSFAWRRTRTETASVPVVQPIPAAHQPLPLGALIEALTPPSVPSLTHARALASLLTSQSPLPRLAVLNPVLASLCSADSPVSVQAAGYDILSAYWENNEAVELTTADRLSFFALFLGSTMSWGMELWEPRFKALRALTRYGADIIGIETKFLDILKSWIEGGFEGLLRSDVVLDRSERAERERSIDVLAKFLSGVFEKTEAVARIPEDELVRVLEFYARLVDRSIILGDSSADKNIASSPDSASSGSTPSKTLAQSHRRNHSSISVASLSSPTTPSTPVLTKGSTKDPADIAITLYLDHLSSQLKTLSPIYLNAVLPLLFRALAFYSSPLPRLTVLPHSNKKASSEDRITETLYALFAGPYSATCMLILKTHLFPPSPINSNENISSQNPIPQVETDIQLLDSTLIAVKTSVGAHRTFRNYVRRALATRLARAYISRESSIGYSPSGAPGHMDMERDLMERAWPKEDYTSGLGSGGNGWDAGRLGKVLTQSVEAWIKWQWVIGAERDLEREQEGKEAVLEESAGVLKDIWQELDVRGEDEGGGLDEEEACVVGETLHKLVAYVHPLRNSDGSTFILPLSRSPTAPTAFLRSLSSLLCRDHTTPISPLLSTILIDTANNLTDTDTANLPRIMTGQHDLSPTSPDWLTNWQRLLGNRTLVSVHRPLTRRAIMEALEGVYESVREMKGYRRPLADIVWEFCERWIREVDRDGKDEEAMWKILGDEVVLRTVENDDEEDKGDQDITSTYIDLLIAAALEGDEEEEEDNGDTSSIATADTQSPSPPALTTPSTTVSPVLSRAQSEYPAQTKEKSGESGLPSVMSIISSLTTGHSSRSHSTQPQVLDEVPDDPVVPPPPPPQEPPSQPRVVAAVGALVAIFSQLTSTPFAFEDRNIAFAIRVYNILLKVTTEGKSTRARLTALQFLMHIRADRDHRVYFKHDTSSHVTMLSTLINRVWDDVIPGVDRGMDEHSPGERTTESREPLPRAPQERDGRQLSRGRGAGGPSRSTASRSRSRVAASTLSPTLVPRRQAPLWRIPETFLFSVVEADLSGGLITYDSEGPDRLILPISLYLTTIIGILEKEKSWEILSYVLCHLPVQLANKHLFCGPKSRDVISKLLNTICGSIIVTRDFASYVDRWPTGLKARDAQGLVYHTLSVLISYRRCFDLKQRHILVEVFQTGLNGQLSTIKCCLHALSLSAFELQPSMTKCLPRILEMLSQIMSNPNMAVHILGFLSIIGSLPHIYANFTEGDFKMVFGVALQFLQHYNRLGASPTTSWALSQHVRILSYTVVYVWFLAVKLQDRPRHIPYITRQLLLANEGNTQVDDPTEVCFDWLARYTYASADPRPAPSVLNNIVMSSPTTSSSPNSLSEKSWILGHSVVTIRTLARRGWIEVLCRRPSGYSKFLCRAENAPMVGSGDVNPDLFSVPAILMMGRDPPKVYSIDKDPDSFLQGATQTQDEVRGLFRVDDDNDDDPETPRPDPITGYVWSGTAPSQRRKDVALDPSYFSLQLSAYPERVDPSSIQTISDPALVTKFITGLDRVPVIDTHKVGIMYVAPGQSEETEILCNTHGSPAYTRFLEGLGRLINLRGQVDVYAGGLDPDEDGEYAYAWWDDIGQILYHTATMMPSSADDPQCNNKKRHIGNDYVRIIWNDSGKPYRFDTLSTQFQFVNIVIEPHSLGAIAAFSNNIHENEYFKVMIQRAPGMTEFSPIGHFKLISAENLPLLVRQLSLLADWFASVFAHTQSDTVRVEMKTNWRMRLEAIRRFKNQIPAATIPSHAEGIMGEEASRDFTAIF